MNDTLVNQYKECAVEIVLLENEIESLTKTLTAKKEYLNTLKMKSQIISGVMSVQEQMNNNNNDNNE